MCEERHGERTPRQDGSILATASEMRLVSVKNMRRVSRYRLTATLNTTSCTRTSNLLMDFNICGEIQRSKAAPTADKQEIESEAGRFSVAQNHAYPLVSCCFEIFLFSRC